MFLVCFAWEQSGFCGKSAQPTELWRCIYSILLILFFCSSFFWYVLGVVSRLRESISSCYELYLFTIEIA